MHIALHIKRYPCGHCTASFDSIAPTQIQPARLIVSLPSYSHISLASVKSDTRSPHQPDLTAVTSRTPELHFIRLASTFTLPPPHHRFAAAAQYYIHSLSTTCTPDLSSFPASVIHPELLQSDDRRGSLAAKKAIGWDISQLHEFRILY